MHETCALDVADRGGITLEEVGEILNLTRERIRQVEVKGLEKLREVASGLGLQDFLAFVEQNISID
jgi:DNA-directed RNA polymerase sigma subunit (sigma70/sigma32)